LSIQSARYQSENIWRVSGYATDSAIEELRRRGCRVETIMSSEEVSRGIERGRGRREPRER